MWDMLCSLGTELRSLYHTLRKVPYRLLIVQRKKESPGVWNFPMSCKRVSQEACMLLPQPCPLPPCALLGSSTPQRASPTSSFPMVSSLGLLSILPCTAPGLSKLIHLILDESQLANHSHPPLSVIISANQHIEFSGDYNRSRSGHMV